VLLLGLDVPDTWPPGGLPPLPDDVDRVLAELDAFGVDVSLQRVDGTDPASAILAGTDPSTLVVVATSPWRSGSGHWFATARRLIRRAPCPVLVVPADLTDPDQR
jgi:nucleotide-binding universal stress UspA family protein